VDVNGDNSKKPSLLEKSIYSRKKDTKTQNSLSLNPKLLSPHKKIKNIFGEKIKIKLFL